MGEQDAADQLGAFPCPGETRAQGASPAQSGGAPFFCLCGLPGGAGAARLDRGSGPGPSGPRSSPRPLQEARNRGLRAPATCGSGPGGVHMCKKCVPPKSRRRLPRGCV